METKANYILIGAFTLAGILGVFGFLLWLAKVEVNRQYAYYDILFDDVSGLATASSVRYNGLPVGQVLSLHLDDDDPSKVRVHIEIDAETPVRQDTIAELQALGVTGVSYVALSGGTPASAPLPSGGTIKSRRSALQSIFEGAPELMSKAISLLEDLQSIVNEENRTAVSKLLENLSSASGRLDQALSDFETLSKDLGGASREIAAFTDKLGKLTETAETTLNTATTALNDTRDAAVSTLDTAKQTFATADGLMKNEITEFIGKGTEVAETVNRVVAEVGTDVTRVAERLNALSDEGSVALAVATETFSNANETLSDISSAMESAGTTLSSANETFESVNKVVNEDVGQIVTDLRGAIDTFKTTVDNVANNVDRIADNVLDASQSASDLMGTVDGIVQQNRRQVSDFMRVGLPQLQRFVEESRRLVVNLDRLVDRIERDPARFLLGTQASEFRQ